MIENNTDQNLIYVLEDNMDIRHIYEREFTAHGYIVETFGTISYFNKAIQNKLCNLCILDLSLPDGDALSVLKSIISEHDLPCIIVSGRGSTSDKVLGLEFGADDYLVKPVDMQELIARVKSVLRRTKNMPRSSGSNASEVYSFEGWKVDFSSMKLVNPSQEEQNLSIADKDLLKAFLESRGTILSREFLLDICQLENNDVFDRSIDVRVARLRKKLNKSKHQSEFIKTIYGAGYLFVPKVQVG